MIEAASSLQGAENGEAPPERKSSHLAMRLSFPAVF